MARNFLFLGRVKRQLIDGTLPNAQAFIYFLVITAVDNIQLAILQIWPVQPTPYTPFAVWSSLALGSVFIVGTYFLNGAGRGRDYLVRYFSISAVVALWIAVPFQSLIVLSRANEAVAQLDWFVPALLLTTNIGIFSFIAFQVRDVAIRSRLVAR